MAHFRLLWASWLQPPVDTTQLVKLSSSGLEVIASPMGHSGMSQRVLLPEASVQDRQGCPVEGHVLDAKAHMAEFAKSG